MKIVTDIGALRVPLTRASRYTISPTAFLARHIQQKFVAKISE